MRGFLALSVALWSLAFTSSALAAVDFTASNLTTPADHSQAIYSADAPNNIHVQGTVTGATPSNADLVCYFGTDHRVLAQNVDTTGNVIDAVVPLQPLTSNRPQPHCTLRAVPTGDTHDYPPDQASSFTGPNLFVGRSSTTRNTAPGINDGRFYNFETAQAQKAGESDVMSAGRCSIDYGFVFDPITFASSDPIFYCNGYFNVANGCPTESGTCKQATSSEIIVDGANAYMAFDATNLYFIDATHQSAPLAGMPNVVFDRSIDPFNGDIHVTESDEIAKCSPLGTAFHPESANAAWPGECSSFVPVGVKLDRTLFTDRDGRRTTMIDTWSSADGAAHDLELLYEEDFNGDPGNVPSPSAQYSWIGPAYSVVSPGDQPPPPTGNIPVTMMVDGNASMADVFQFPQAAVTYSDAPGYLRWYYSEGAVTAAVLDYKRHIPIGGSVTFAHSYIAGVTKAEVQDQLADEQARIGRPKLAITSPADGSTVNDPSLLVTGTAGDPDGGLTGLTVNGDAVTVGADGSWSKAVTLAQGPSTVFVTGTDTNGNTTTATAKVTYTPAPAPPAPVPAGGGTTPDTTAPTLGLSVAKVRLGALLGKGLTVKARAGEACTITLTLMLGSKPLAKASGRLGAAGTKKLVLKLSKKARKALSRAKKPRLTLKGSARDAAGNIGRRTIRLTIGR